MSLELHFLGQICYTASNLLCSGFGVFWNLQVSNFFFMYKYFKEKSGTHNTSNPILEVQVREKFYELGLNKTMAFLYI
jgi:hypothetical protein